MNKIKVSKYKNTGLIFELLSRRVVSEVLTGDSPALKLIKRYFKYSSELGKEYSLYKLFSSKKNISESTIDIAINEFSKLDAKLIGKQKYNLIKEIKQHYDLHDFFKHKVANYRLNGALSYLYENTGFGNIDAKIQARKIVLEHIKAINQPKMIVENDSLQGVDKDTQKLAVKIMLEKFNNKYANLTPEQQTILSNFIIDGIASTKFKKFVIGECVKIEKKLSTVNTPSERLNIKIKEAISLLENIITSKEVKEDHVSALLKYHELIYKTTKEI
jgi:hypothetical protein